MNCPYCNKKIDAHTCLEDGDSVPTENDLSACSYCGGISVFGKNGESLRKIDEVDKLAVDEKTLQTALAASRYIKFRKVQLN